MQNLWRHWPKVRLRLTSHRRIALLLDFDGTLSPLVPHPSRARLARGLRPVLKELASLRDVTVVILSGRPLFWLKDAVGISSLYYVGNHGLEISGPGLRFRHPGAMALRPLIRVWAKKFASQLAFVPEAMVEDKGLTLSLHSRAVPPSRLALFAQTIRRLRAHTRFAPVAWRRGQQVWEICPRVDWNKGHGAVFLLRHVGHPFAVALGDDRTDEDMFRALGRSGVTIRVGRSSNSSACYYLGRQRDVLRFLNEIRYTLEQNRTSPRVLSNRH